MAKIGDLGIKTFVLLEEQTSHQGGVVDIVCPLNIKSSCHGVCMYLVEYTSTKAKKCLCTYWDFRVWLLVKINKSTSEQNQLLHQISFVLSCTYKHMFLICFWDVMSPY